MAYSKVILNGTTLMDVTNDTVDADNLLSGETATKSNGLRTTGTVVVPTKTSDLTNDSGFITSAQAPVQSVNGQTGAVSITIPTVPSASTTTPSMDGTASYGSGTTWARADHVHPTDTSRQAALVSGQNIKTINNESLLGSGNITIQGGGGTALTDQEIDDAVELAYAYNVAYSGDALSSVNIVPSGNKVTAGTVVRITNTSTDYPVDIAISSPLGVSTRIAVGGYYEFTMPLSDISVTLNLYQVASYPISYTAGSQSSTNLMSTSTDGSKVVGQYVTSAEAGATITMWFGGRWEPVVTRNDTSAEITCTRTEIDTSSGRKTTWICTMPEVGITIDAYYND